MGENLASNRNDLIEQQMEHFEKISTQYYAGRQSKNHLLLKELMWDYFFQEKSFLRKDGLSVLEPMCGYSEGKVILERHLGITIHYEGFDYSETFVNMVKSQDPSISITRQDITKFMPSKEYDLVILLGGIHHVPDMAAEVIKKMASSLKDGGYFINLEPTYNNFITKLVSNEVYKKNPLFDYETEKRFELRELNDLYLSNGFEIVDQIYPGLLSYVLYYNPDAFPLLDVGRGGLTRFLFGIDKFFFRNVFGRKLSFATLTLLKKHNYS